MEESANALAAETELKKFGLAVEDVGSGIVNHGHMLSWSHNDSNFIKVSGAPREQSASLATICSSENSMLAKIVLALSAVGQEMDFCVSEAKDKFFDTFLFFGEALEDDNPSEATKAVSRMLPSVLKASNFTDHCAEVVLNVVHQLASIRDPQSALKSAEDVHVQVIYDKLSQLLGTLVILDGIVLQHGSFRGHWATYRRYIKAAIMDPKQYNVDVNAMKMLEKLLGDSEAKVVDGNIFKNCVDQPFNKNGFFVTNNSAFCEEFLFCLRNIITDVELSLNSGSTMVDPNDRVKMVGLFGLMSLHIKVFGSIDKKLTNKIWELCKKVTGITLHGKVMWFPEQFIIAHMPFVAKMMDKKLVQTLASNRHSFLQNKAQSCQSDVKAFHLQLNGWLVKMESAFRGQPGPNLTLEHVERATNLLLQGLALATELRSNITAVLNLHAKLSVPLSKTNVISLCKSIELLKAVEATFHRHSLATASLSGHICQKLASSIISTIGRAKAIASKGVDKRFSQSRLDILAALLLAETAIAGPPTYERRLVTEIALNFASQNKTFSNEDLVMLMVLMKKLFYISRLEELIESSCDTSFFYWHRVVLNVYFDHIFETKNDAYRLPYTFRALGDCCVPLRKAKHLESPQALENSFGSEIEEYFNTRVLLPLCQHLETDLRYHAHSHLQLEDRNPFKVGGGVHDASSFLLVKPIKFMHKYINIKARVEAYLEKTFYNLTTVALHNWRTYGEMRALATHKYKAETVDDHLPSQTLEQGLDVLEIMRNIHVFVSNYLYNLNHQVFIEATSQNKHLNTINIRHIANSIRTHGVGIMNTTVNFTYQFLRKKFAIFSQFLFDDQIKSRLSKDARFFRENATSLDQKFPFDRADKFNKGIRKLGVLDGNSTYLDQFRMLISQIGNAMGYVRMIKAGGLHFVSNSIRFVPDLDDIPNFEKLSIDEGLDGEAVEAAKTLDEVVSSLSKNFSDTTEYFQLLVNVFGKQLQEAKHPHLKNFYLIVPSLSVNYVEYMIAAKDKMAKNNFNGAAFTDDGLAMGIAYILVLLNQSSSFDSLRWFESVREKYIKEKSEVERQSAEAVSDQKLQQTMALTLKRLETYQKEFELLYYNLSSARIFFRTENSNYSEEEKEQEAEEE